MVLPAVSPRSALRGRACLWCDLSSQTPGQGWKGRLEQSPEAPGGRRGAATERPVQPVINQDTLALGTSLASRRRQFLHWPVCSKPRTTDPLLSAGLVARPPHPQPFLYEMKARSSGTRVAPSTAVMRHLLSQLLHGDGLAVLGVACEVQPGTRPASTSAP